MCGDERLSIEPVRHGNPDQMTSSPPRILGIGAAHIDRRGRMSGPYQPAASNPGTMHEEAGGAVFNAVRTVVQRGVGAGLVAAIGGDAAGRTVEASLAEYGVANHCGVFLDRATASYTAFLDDQGDLVAGLADMDIHETALPRLLRRKAVTDLAANAHGMLIDANMPEDGIKRAVDLADGKPVYAIAVSIAKVVRYRPVLPRLACLFMNRREAAALTRSGDGEKNSLVVAGLREAGLESAMITDGASVLHAFDRECIWALDPPAIDQITDVTGAGDALAGAASAAMLQGRTVPEAMREGTAAALCAIASTSAAPDLKDGQFEDALAKVSEPRKVAAN